MNQHLRDISLDLSEWTHYKTVNSFHVLGFPITGLEQHCYQRVISGEVLSAGVFELKGKRTHIAWGIKSEPHCSFHALALPDGSWGTVVDGCPEYQVLRHNANIIGFRVDGTVFTIDASAPPRIFSIVRAKFQQFTPLILFFSLAMLWATGKQVLFADTLTHIDHAGIATLQFFHEWMLDFMGGFFLLFGTLKVLRLRKFAHSFSSYDLLAIRYPSWSYVYPFIEISIGLLYTLRLFLPLAHILATLFLGIATVSIYLKLHAREEVTCACLGGFFDVPLTKVSLIENFIMACMALYMLFLTL